MRDSHRVEAERLLARAVEEEVRRSGGRVDGGVLLSRARAALDTLAQPGPAWRDIRRWRCAELLDALVTRMEGVYQVIRAEQR
ncbi:hypothetical protein ABT317_42415, partial [Streptomyces carpinensis]